MIEIFVIVVLALKLFGFLELSWSLTLLFVTALIVIRLQIYLEKKSLHDAVVRVADAVDSSNARIWHEIGQKQDRKIDEYSDDYY